MPQELKLGPTVSFEHEGGWRVGRKIEQTALLCASRARPEVLLYVLVLCGKTNQIFRVAEVDLQPYPSEPIPEPTK